MGFFDKIRELLGDGRTDRRGEQGAPVAFDRGHGRDADARLLLLSKFTAPADASNFGDYWASVLSEPLRQAVERMLGEGLLELAPLPDALAAAHQARELKELAKARGLKVSGTKAVLSTRLASADPDGMKALLGDRKFLVCSARGSEVAVQWRARMDAARRAAQEQVVTLLKARRFADAGRVVARYEASQVFARGLGIRWDQGADPAGVVPDLAAIFAGVPKILSRAGAEELEVLRVAAASSLLWGDRSEDRWLPEGFVSASGFDNDVAVRMYVFYARHVSEIERMRGIVRTVKLSPVDDHATCDACRALEGRTFALRNAPELPHPACTSPMGCRCIASAHEFGE
jgi:hypothetical protein